MKRLLVAAPILMLAGCATTGLEQGLAGLVGQRVDVVVAQLGAPSAERRSGDMRLVEWDRSRVGTVYTPTAGPNNGFLLPKDTTMALSPTLPNTLLARFPDAKPVPTSSRPVPQYCKLTLQVDSDNVIRRYAYDGNFDGCYAHARTPGKPT
jgi:hypothetical protein